MKKLVIELIHDEIESKHLFKDDCLAEAREEPKSTVRTETPALNLNNEGKTSQILNLIRSYDLLISSGRICELFDVFPKLKFKYGDNCSD